MNGGVCPDLRANYSCGCRWALSPSELSVCAGTYTPKHSKPSPREPPPKASAHITRPEELGFVPFSPAPTGIPAIVPRHFKMTISAGFLGMGSWFHAEASPHAWPISAQKVLPVIEVLPVTWKKCKVSSTQVPPSPLVKWGKGGQGKLRPKTICYRDLVFL